MGQPSHPQQLEKPMNTLSRRSFLSTSAASLAGGLAAIHARESQAAGTPADDLFYIAAFEQAIMNSAESDGSIAAIGYDAVGTPLLQEPYFAGLAIACLLQSHAFRPSTEKLDVAEQYIHWQCTQLKQDQNVFWIYSSLRAANGGQTNLQRKRADADDSAASMLLYNIALLARYRTVSPLLIESMYACLNILRGCDDGRGLYYNFAVPPAGVTPAQYLTDACETFAALHTLQFFADQLGDDATRNEVRNRASILATWMRDFYYNGKFAVLYGDTQNGHTNAWGGQPGPVEGLANYTILFSAFDVPQHVSAHVLAEIQNRYIDTFQYPDFAFNWGLNYAFPQHVPDTWRAGLAMEYAGTLAQRNEYATRMQDRSDIYVSRAAQLLAGETPLHCPYVHSFGGAMVYHMKRIGAGADTQFPRALLGWN